MDFPIPQQTFALMVAYLKLSLLASSIAVTAGDVTCRLVPEQDNGGELDNDAATENGSLPSDIRTEDDDLAGRADRGSSRSTRESVEGDSRSTSVSPSKSTGTPEATSTIRSSSGIPVASQPATVNAIASAKQLKKRAPPETSDGLRCAKRRSKVSKRGPIPVARDSDDDFDGDDVFDELAGAKGGAQGEAPGEGGLGEEARERGIGGEVNEQEARTQGGTPEGETRGGGSRVGEPGGDGTGDGETGRVGTRGVGTAGKEARVEVTGGAGSVEEAVVGGAACGASVQEGPRGKGKKVANASSEAKDFAAALGKLYTSHDGKWDNLGRSTQQVLVDAALVLGGTSGILELREFIRWQRENPGGMYKYHGLVRASPEPEMEELSSRTASKGAVVRTPRKAQGPGTPKRSPLAACDVNASMGARRVGKGGALGAPFKLSDPVQVAANHAQARCVYSWEAVTTAARMESVAKASRVWHLLRLHEHYEDAVDKMQLTYHGADARVEAKQVLAEAMRAAGNRPCRVEGAQKAKASIGRMKQGGSKRQSTGVNTLENVLREAGRFAKLAETFGEGVVVFLLGLSGVLKRYLQRVPERLLDDWVSLVLEKFPWVETEAFRVRLDAYLQKVVEGSPPTDDGRLLVLERTRVAPLTAINERWGRMSSDPGSLMEVEGVAKCDEEEVDVEEDEGGGQGGLGPDFPFGGELSSFTVEYGGGVGNLDGLGLNDFRVSSSEGAEFYATGLEGGSSHLRSPQGGVGGGGSLDPRWF